MRLWYFFGFSCVEFGVSPRQVTAGNGVNQALRNGGRQANLMAATIPAVIIGRQTYLTIVNGGVAFVIRLAVIQRQARQAFQRRTVPVFTGFEGSNMHERASFVWSCN